MRGVRRRGHRCLPHGSEQEGREAEAQESEELMARERVETPEEIRRRLALEEARRDGENGGGANRLWRCPGCGSGPVGSRIYKEPCGHPEH